MCGIVGVVLKSHNGFFAKQQNSAYQLLYADALRGEDSTGVIGIENDSSFHIAKEAASADWFIHQLKHDKACKVFAEDVYRTGKAIIGHNRKKTVGRIDDETAHPFVVNKTFAMVHNGTLYNHRTLANVEVDSEALAIHLHKAFEEGGGDEAKLKEALNVALGRVNGAYACAIYDQTQHKVHLLRNKERPLFFVETDDAWYFMSELAMGYWILARNEYKVADLKAELVPEHVLISFELSSNKVTRSELEPKKSLSHNTNTNLVSRGTTTPTRGTTAIADEILTKAKDLSKFKKNMLGKRLTFWVDEILEDDIKTSIEDGATKVTLFGQDEDCKWYHDLLAEVDLEPLKISTREDVMNARWSGVVDTIEQAKSGCLKINLKGCKPVAKSVSKGAANDEEHKGVSFAQRALAFRQSIGAMTSDKLYEYFEENKYQLDTWQHTSITVELAWRQNIKSVEQAARIARERDCCVIEQKRVGNLFVYANNDGRIYYETPAIVH